MVRMKESGTRFEAAAAPFRRELAAFCYRMMGSPQEVDDLVQETYLRAWRAFDRFEHRSSVRTWLYRIATNVCLTALSHRPRRSLPSGLGPPSADPGLPLGPAPAGTLWLQPVPDHLVVDERADPAEVVAARHSVRLALVAALQLLPPRQRAAFIMCEVLALPVAHTAHLLDVSVPAAKSLLQRARARLADVTLEADDLADPTDAGARRVLDRYMKAFEGSDMAALERLLAEDAVLEMTGTTTWFAGKTTCVPFLASQAIGRRGEWRMAPLRTNGQLGSAAYRRGQGGAYSPFAVVVLATTSSHITRISLFSDPDLFARFGLARVP